VGKVQEKETIVHQQQDCSQQVKPSFKLMVYIKEETKKREREKKMYMRKRKDGKRSEKKKWED
jgi:hypothetical protein